VKPNDLSLARRDDAPGRRPPSFLAGRLGPAGSLAAVLALLASGHPLGAGEAEVNARWQGAWVVTRGAVRSDCGGRYTNNELRGDLVVGDGRFSLPPGELGQVAKVNVNRRRVELLVDLTEAVLAERVEGPFTLYDEAACRVELRLDRPEGGDEVIERALAAVVERHASVDAARESGLWNERRREDYPPDYEATLAEHAVWRAQQVNGEVQARLDEAIEETASLARGIDDEAEYLAGLAAGIDHGRKEYYDRDCAGLLSKSAYAVVDRPPSGQSGDWEEGYADGQRLLYFAEMAKRLRGCFVPPPVLAQ
jgi:hypothetical protein